jgi:hypothetical protein
MPKADKTQADNQPESLLETIDAALIILNRADALATIIENCAAGESELDRGSLSVAMDVIRLLIHDAAQIVENMGGDQVKKDSKL